MKMSDINQKLTEQPGGFGGIIKSKIQSQLPFARKQQRAGKAKTALYTKARAIKKELQNWKAEAFAATNGEDTSLTMNQFLGWVKNRQPKYAQGIETIARSDKDYTDFFSQKIDKKGKQSSTASDPKVKVRDTDEIPPGKVSNSPPEKISDKDKQAGYDKIAKDAEKEAAEFDKQDLKASKGEDKEPKADTSASIYEERLRALLEDDVGVNRAKTLTDNQIDTLITLGIQKQKELNSGGDDISAGEPEATVSTDKPTAATTADNDFLSEYRDELENVLTKVVNGEDLDKRDQRNARDMLNSI